MRFCLCFAGLLLAGGGSTLQAKEPDAAALEFFEKKVRPVLVENCHKCHSASQKQRGGLLLDSRGTILKGGDTGPAVVSGEPEKSLLIKAIRYKDDLRMPPRSKLPDTVIADLTRWVEMGAPWPDDRATTGPASTFDLEKRKQHWSFQPIGYTPPPRVKDATWTRSPVDRFILHRLEQAGLRPAPPADPLVWLRRVTFDLTGLPPTPGEIQAFEERLRELGPTASEPALEEVVDRLLASPAYGERWARHWLDLVRFAETAGHEFDFEMPEAHLYRDYVVRALNNDVPYDQFVREHVAGDLLENPRRHPVEGFNESILGTGFWFLGESKHSPVDLRGDGADRRDNQVDVFGKTFLGLTIACARCHDHKFDAITTEDYYCLVSYLQSSRYQLAFLDPPDRVSSFAERIAELRDEINGLAREHGAHILLERVQKLASARKSATARDSLFDEWDVLAKPELSAEQFLKAKSDLLQKYQADQARVQEQQKQAVLFEDFARGYDSWFVTGDAFGTKPTGPDHPNLKSGDSLEVDNLAGVHRAHGGLISGKLQGALRSATFTISHRFIHYRIAGRGTRVNLIIDGFQRIRNPIYGGLTFNLNSDSFVWHTQDLGMWQGLKAYIEVLDDGEGYAALDRVVFSDAGPPREELPNSLMVKLLEDEKVRDFTSIAREYQNLLAEIVFQWRDGKLAGQSDRIERVELLNRMLASPTLNGLPVSRENEPARKRMAILQAEIAKLESQLPAPRRGMAMADGTGVHEHIHIRGNHKNLGAEAPRRFLEALGGKEPPHADRGSGRLELAGRMVSPSNPLVARVIVNRLWHHHFGTGLVRTPDNLGVQGEPPTHPALLDWLALELMRRGWSLKEMHRLMVLSSTYRMSSRSDPQAAKTDPLNKLWHHIPIRRLEAEAIRDAMLSASGQLDRRMFGPGPLPHLTPFMVGRGRPGRSGPLDGEGRRSLYLNVRRNFLNPLFLAFDYPIPFSTMGKRTVSNVPAQALILMNNPFVVEQAQRWAEQILAQEAHTPTERIELMYLTAFGRSPTQTEVEDALAFVEDQTRLHGGNGAVRAWADLCHVLFNVKEFVFVN